MLCPGKAPLTVTLGESNAKDYATVLMAMSAKQVDAEAIYALHSQLSPADLKASVARVLSNSKGGISTEALVASIRDELVSVSAVAPEEVEPVDLADFPGLEGIKEELERNVLFPLENPDQAKKFGLTPKRGVLLHGQPGTGKTTVGRWLANRPKGKFFLVREMMLQAPACCLNLFGSFWLDIPRLPGIQLSGCYTVFRLSCLSCFGIPDASVFVSNLARSCKFSFKSVAVRQISSRSLPQHRQLLQQWSSSTMLTL